MTRVRLPLSVFSAKDNIKELQKQGRILTDFTNCQGGGEDLPNSWCGTLKPNSKPTDAFLNH